MGRRIAELRKAAGLTQEQLAQEIDSSNVSLSAGYLSNIEMGYPQPSTDLLRAFARRLNADYNELATLAGYQAPPSASTWVPPPDKAGPLRRLSDLFSFEQLEAGERLLRSVFLEGVPPREPSERERDDDRDPDEPQPKA